MKHVKFEKLNNKGLSLVELIIAIAIGVIISGAIAALITFSVRVYQNESTNLSAQYELMSNANQIEDTIMEAGCYVIQKATSLDPAGRFTEYAAFGTFKGGNFEGVVFVAGLEKSVGGVGTDRFDIYMDRGVWASDSTPKTASDAVSDHVAEMKKTWTVGNANFKDPNPYLLGEDAKTFRIRPKVLTEPSTYVNIASGKYTNPLAVEFELDFEKDAAGKVVNKHVKDEALIRNRVSTPIYIDGTAYTLKTDE